MTVIDAPVSAEVDTAAGDRRPLAHPDRLVAASGATRWPWDP